MCQRGNLDSDSRTVTWVTQNTAMDAVTISALLTAVGTLVLAIATFGATRSANRAARVAERALQVNLRPVLMASRFDDPMQKIRFQDDHWVRVNGGSAAVEICDDVIYLVMSLRNVGAGIGVLQGYYLWPSERSGRDPHPEPEQFTLQTRDLYVAAGDVGVWQAALRDRSDPRWDHVVAAAKDGRLIIVDLLYSDHDAGQRTITRYAITPASTTDHWLISAARHWNLDRADPHPT